MTIKKCTQSTTESNLKNYKIEKEYRRKSNLSAGRLVPWKGFKELIEAMSALQNGNYASQAKGPISHYYNAP